MDKDSREHFEIRTHSRMIDIYTLSSQTLKEAQKLKELELIAKRMMLLKKRSAKRSEITAYT